MKITQKQAIAAYRAVRKLEYQDMPGREAMTLFKMRSALEPQFKFQDEQEHKFVETLNCEINDNGSIDFPDDETRGEFINKLNELAELEVEIEIEKTKFDVSNLKLSAMDIEALETIMDIVC